MVFAAASNSPVIKYGIDFVVGVVTPKNAFKYLIALNKPFVVLDAAVKQYTKSISKLTPLLANSIKLNFAWKDALFPIGLLNTALTKLFLTTRTAIYQITTELRTFAPSLTAAFNPIFAIQSIQLLKPLLTSLTLQTSQFGQSWKDVTNLVVDNAAQLGVMSLYYAEVATEVSKYVKTSEKISAITTSSIELAEVTGLLRGQLTVVVEQLAKLAATANLSTLEIQSFNQGITVATTTLPVTIEYISQFTAANAALIKANTLSLEQVTAYGLAFEQLGVDVEVGKTALQKLATIVQSPNLLSNKGVDGLAQLGFTVKELTDLTQGEGGLNGALTVLLQRIQGISNTNPSAAIGAIGALLGNTSSGASQNAQSILALANGVGAVESALGLLQDTAGNSEIVDELGDIAGQADPVGDLALAFTGLTETWGTVLEPLVITIAPLLTEIVLGITGLVAGIRDTLSGAIFVFANLNQVLSTILPIIKPLIWYWSVFNATTATTKLAAVGLAQVTKFLLAKNLFGLAVVTGFVSRQLSLLHIFLATKLIPTVITFGQIILSTWKTALTWQGFKKIFSVIGATIKKELLAFLPNVLTITKALYVQIAPFLPLIFAVTAAIFTVQAAWKTFVATTAKAKLVRDNIKAINDTSKELSASFEAIGIGAKGATIENDSLWNTIATGASNALEFIRDNISIYEHLGKLIGNNQLAQFKFATQAEASANRAAAAYGDLLTTIDSYGTTYSAVVAKLKESPTDQETLTAGNSLVELLRQQKKALESVEVTKDQAASKQAYLKSLDQQIRYVSKLSVGNDVLKNSIDQAEVSVENMQEALDNLRSKVGDERSKEVEKEIDLLTESAAKVEETEKAKVDAADDTAKKQFDAQEKTIRRQEQLADRQLDRTRAKEDEAIQQRQEAEDKAIEERYAKEDARYQESFDKKEASITKQQELEQAAIEAQQALEDKALDKQIAAEDKAIEDRIALEDKAIERRIAAEDKAIERITAAEDKQLQQRIEAEDEAIAAIIEAEDKALAKQIEDEDAAIAARLDKELTAIADRATAAEDAINAEVKLRDEALTAQLDRELAAVDAGLTAREEALATELAAREAAANKLGDATNNNLEAQQQAALQAAEATFNAQQRAQDAAYQLRKQGIEQAHSNKLTQQEAAAKQRVLQLEEQFNTRLIEKQLAAVEQRKAKELAAVSSREDAALKAFDRQQQLQNAPPEERARLQAEFELTDKLEAQRQAIRDKYEAERLAKEAEAEKAKLALEAEKAKKEQELAAAKKKEEESAAAEKAKLEAEQAAALEKLELEKEAAKAERQAAYEKQQEEIKLAFETKLQEAKAATEATLNELKLANEKAIEELKQAAEAKRNELKLANEKQLEDNKLAAEEKITQLKLAADQAAEKLRLQYETEAEQRALKREAAQDARTLQREQEAEQRALQRESQAEQVQLQREQAAATRADQREREAATRADQREAQAEQLKEQREQAAEQRKLQREQAATARAEQIDAAKEQRAKQFEDAQARRDEQREAAKESRDKQREESAYQRQLKREDEDYARQLKREEEAAVRQEAFDAAKDERAKAYEAAKAERDKALAEQVADREAELARELEIIKLQTQESIEQSYGEIVAKLKASADEIAAAARAANASAATSPTPSPGRRFKGGTVRAGVPYWVGEDRRTGRLTPNSELFIPRSAGYIANASQVWEMIRTANKVRQYQLPSVYSPVKPKAALSEVLLLKELNSIRRDVGKLADTVNSRTNQLNTKTAIINKTHYGIN